MQKNNKLEDRKVFRSCLLKFNLMESFILE